jgi:hypothetical protein
MVTPKQLKDRSSEERQATRLKKLTEYIDEVLDLYWEPGYGVDIPLGSQPDEWGLELFQATKQHYEKDWTVRDYIEKDLSFGIIFSDPEDGFIPPQKIIYIEGITRKNDPFKHLSDPRSTEFTLVSQSPNWED